MASEEQAASRPIHRKSAPSPTFAAKELPRATDKYQRNSRPIVRPRLPATAFPGRAIEWDFVHQRVDFPSPSANRIRPATAPMCAPELRLARMEFPAAGLLPPGHAPPRGLHAEC